MATYMFREQIGSYVAAMKEFILSLNSFQLEKAVGLVKMMINRFKRGQRLDSGAYR